MPHLHQPDSRGHVGGILEPQVDAAVGIELNAHHLQDIAAPRKPRQGREAWPVAWPVAGDRVSAGTVAWPVAAWPVAWPVAAWPLAWPVADDADAMGHRVDEWAASGTCLAGGDKGTRCSTHRKSVPVLMS